MTVCLAVPIRNRAHFLHEFLPRILEQDYELQDIILYFFTHDNADITYDILADWVARNGGKFQRVVIDREDRDFPPDARDEAYRAKYIRPAMVHAFNRCLDFGASTDVDHVIFSDSDSLYPPNFISSLISAFENDREIIAPLEYSEVEVGDRIIRVTHVYKNVDGNMKISYESLPENEKITVDCVSGVIAYPKAVLQLGIRFELTEPSNRFEFVYIERYRDAGIKIRCLTGLKVEHVHRVTSDTLKLVNKKFIAH